MCVRNAIIPLLLVLSMTVSHAADTLSTRLSRQLGQWPQEKIYVQTDKAAYLSGERMWLRVHICDAATRRPLWRSRYVYVELLNPFSELVGRIMLRPDSLGVFAGYVDLAEELPEGSYTLRSYTRYMENQGTESFFRKGIRVLDPHSLNLSETHGFEHGAKAMGFRVSFGDRSTGALVTPEVVTVRTASGRETRLRPSDGTFFGTVPSSSEGGAMLLSIKHEGRIYRKFIGIPCAPGAFDVSFLPEGGYLVPGKACRVGVKALGPDGRGIDVTGSIVDDTGRETAEIGPLYKGMGSFLLKCETGRRYTAVCRSGDGTERRFPLPEPSSSAHVLQIFRAGKNLFVREVHGEEASVESFRLLVHKGGMPVYEGLWALAAAYLTIPLEDLPSGVLCFALVDTDGNIVSERLVFNVNDREIVKYREYSSTDSSGPRQKVSKTLKFSSEVAGSVICVGVVDADAAMVDTEYSLESTLLLSSELKGRIEAPADYFSDGLKVQELDALMLTQGWRRYDIPAVLKGKTVRPSLPAEKSQKVTGKAEAYIFNSMDGGVVSLYATKDSRTTVSTSTMSRDGRFSFDVEFPEDTEITVQTRTKKGGKGNMLKVDEVTYPSFSGAALPQPVEVSGFFADAYMRQADEAYLLEHGIRSTMLEAAVVAADMEAVVPDSKWYSPVSSSEPMTNSEISRRHYNDILTVFLNTPGLAVRRNSEGNYVTTTRSELPVLPVIDDVVLPEYDVFNLGAGDIDNMFVVKDQTAMFGYYPGFSGALVVKTVSGPSGYGKSKSDNILRVKPLGYQEPVQFYSPAYDGDDRDSALPDLRTTLYWNPGVKVAADGTALVEFWTADPDSSYLLIGEGVGPAGQLIRADLEIGR